MVKRPEDLEWPSPPKDFIREEDKAKHRPPSVHLDASIQAVAKRLSRQDFNSKE